MIVFVQREPHPDAPYWPGRRLLAAIDAVLWPIGWAILVHQIPSLGKGGSMVTFVAMLFALYRLSGALFTNHRYWFTTWWVVRAVALLLLCSFVLKLALWVSAASH